MLNFFSTTFTKLLRKLCPRKCALGWLWCTVVRFMSSLTGASDKNEYENPAASLEANELGNTDEQNAYQGG